MKQALLCAGLLLAVSLVIGHDLHPLTTASTHFSQILYQKLALNESTVAYSPYSIHVSLSLLAIGAHGETAAEFFRVLCLQNLAQNFICSAYRILIQELNCLKEVHVYSPNFVVVRPQQSILQQYINELRNYFYTAVGKFDYGAVGGPEKPINDYVERKTNGYILNLLPPRFVRPDTALLVISGFHFNGTWRDQFSPDKTVTQDFHTVCEPSKQVQVMNDVRYVYAKRNVLGADVIELPFRGDRVSFYVVLPNQLETITTLESSLTNPQNLNQLFTGLQRTCTQISIPKFRAQSKFLLAKPVQELGIRRAFDARYAQLQGISREQLHVTQLVHSAVIDITETGTVAAAPVPSQSVISPRGPAFVFNAKHSFLYFLRDNLSQQILLQGKYSG